MTNTLGTFRRPQPQQMMPNIGYYYPTAPQLQQSQSQWNNSVNTNIEMIQGGYASVSALQLPNNSMYCYFDDQKDVVYIKQVDANGRASVQAYDLVPQGQHTAETIATTAAAIDTSDFITREQLDELSEQLTRQIADISKKLNDFKAKMGNISKKEGNK